MCQYGCEVIKTIIRKYPNCQLIEKLLENIIMLIHNQYGSNVIEHLLIFGGENNRAKIIDAITGKTRQLKQHKFARYGMSVKCYNVLLLTYNNLCVVLVKAVCSSYYSHTC